MEGDREFEARKAQHQFDSQAWFHQDRLHWSRFQTAATIEAAVLVATYQLQVSPLECLVFAGFGCALVLIVCILALKDSVDSGGHMDRMNKFHGDYGAYPWQARPWPFPKGIHWVLLTVILLTVFNAMLMITLLVRVLRAAAA